MAGNNIQRVCLCLTVISQLYGIMGLYISHIKEKVNWKEAHRRCQVCNGSLIQLNEDSRDFIYGTFPEIYNESVWITNYSTENSFTFEGCATQENIQNHHNTFNIVNNNADLCHIMCKGYMYFAIKRELCICYEGEDFNKTACHSDMSTFSLQSKVCSDSEFMVYSDLVMRCTFDDCRCKSIQYEEPWFKSKKCYGEEGITSNLLNHKTRHVGCALITATSKPNKTVSSLTFHVPQRRPLQNMCLSFGYYMNGIRVQSLEIYFEQNNRTRDNTPIWKQGGNLGNKWHTAYVNITLTNSFKIVIIATLTANVWNGVKNYIAVDNVTVSNGYCQKKPLLFDCSFETDLCGWIQPYSANKLKWLRNSRQTPTSRTGPESDSRDLNGFYAYMNAAYGKNIETALMLSPIVTLAKFKTFCLRFSYQMYGNNVDILSLYVKEKDSEDRIIWENDNKDRKWKYAIVSFSASTSFALKFEGEKKGRYGDIAIDDIRLSDGMCDDEKLMYCKFTERSDTCGWKHIGSTSNKWAKEEKYLMTKLRATTKESELQGPDIYQFTGWTCLYIQYSVSQTAALLLLLKLHYSEKTYFLQRFDNPGSKKVNIFVPDRFKLILKAILQKKKATTGWVKIHSILLTKGKCDNKSATARSICTVMHEGSIYFSDCSLQSHHSYLCESDELPSTSSCNFSFIGRTHTETTTPNLETTSSSTADIDTNVTGETRRHFASSTDDVISLQVFTTLLAVLCVSLVVIVVLLVLKIRRNGKQNETLRSKEISTKSMSNIGYEYEIHQAVSKLNPKESETQCNGKKKINNTEYELACAIESVHAKEITEGKESGKDRIDVYQNTSFFENKETVYQETKEGEYDHIGQSRESGQSTNADTYDHTMESGYTRHGDYDYCSAPGNATVPEDSNYFVLEKEDYGQLSNIYDHAK